MRNHQSVRKERSLKDPLKSNAASEVIFLQLSDLILIERCYLDSGLKIEYICLRLRTTTGSLLKVLKSKGFRNFSHFINHHRVEEAKKLMALEAFEVFTLEAIAVMAGFGTRQTFYNAFERLVGMKPARYRSIVKRHYSALVSNAAEP